MTTMTKPFFYIKKYSKAFLLTLSLGLAFIGHTQDRKVSYEINMGYEFASAYYEKHTDIPTIENIKANIKLGIIGVWNNDTGLVSRSVGIYYRYRSFQVKMNVQDIDPNYNTFLTSVNPQYHIVGIPFALNWKVFTKNNLLIQVKTGLSFEVSVYRYEFSEYNDGAKKRSSKLVRGNYDWQTGIPLVLGFGADYQLNKEIKLGFYPTVNFYFKKFDSMTEAGYASVFGIDLFLFLK